MSSFLQNLSNPFQNSVLAMKIEQATDASLDSENWALNMEICDLINESSDNAKDAMKAIRKRLTQYIGKNYTVILLTLTVLETCVKNCGKQFHMLVANKEFIHELVKLIGPKYDPPSAVQEKVLSLIQVWADTFSNQPDLSGVVQVYNELKSKGIVFPVADLDNAVPIYTPQKSVVQPPPIMPAQQQPQQQQTVTDSPHHHQQAAPGEITAEQIAKLQSELDIVSMNMSILSEMLNELKPNQESPADYKLLIDLVATCKEMQNRIVDLVGKVNNDEITAELLRLNDELNNLFLRYARYEKNRDPKTAVTNTPSAILGAAMGVPMPSSQSDTAKESLIDLNDQAAAGTDNIDNLNTKFSALSTSQLSKISSVTAQSGPKSSTVDEFDMLAQSRTASETKGSDFTSLKPSDFDEMEAWLDKNDNPTTTVGNEESLTSKEFDKFLAERALAAENLPSVNSSTETQPQSQQRSKKKDEEAALLGL